MMNKYGNKENSKSDSIIRNDSCHHELIERRYLYRQLTN